MIAGIVFLLICLGLASLPMIAIILLGIDLHNNFKTQYTARFYAFLFGVKSIEARIAEKALAEYNKE